MSFVFDEIGILIKDTFLFMTRKCKYKDLTVYNLNHFVYKKVNLSASPLIFMIIQIFLPYNHL